MNVNRLVADLEPELCRLAGPDNPVEFSLCEGLTPVIAEPGNIAQIVTRLVILVRDFGPDGKTIQLSTAIVANTPVTNGLAAVGSFVSLSVSAAADGERVDDGMSTSRAILAQYGGTLTAVVEPGSAGSNGQIRYTLYVPLASSVNPIADRVPEPGCVMATVLLVEEEPLIRELSRDLLERQGFRVLTAGTAAEAERIARGEQSFDVLIADWATDDGKSGALAQLLRGMRPELRVLFISGYGDGPEAGIPRQDGSATLQKPFSGESLARKIRQLLGKPE
jgi:two-component system cell cycle sensor histidine kinase/response regulator CckA